MQLQVSEVSGRISGLEKKIQYAEIEKVTEMIVVGINFLSSVTSMSEEL